MCPIHFFWISSFFCPSLSTWGHNDIFGSQCFPCIAIIKQSVSASTFAGPYRVGTQTQQQRRQKRKRNGYSHRIRKYYCSASQSIAKVYMVFEYVFKREFVEFSQLTLKQVHRLYQCNLTFSLFRFDS